MTERVSMSTLKCVNCESPLQVESSLVHLRCAYCGIIQQVIQVGERVYLRRFSESDQANAEKQVKRLLKEMESLTIQQQHRRESAASRLAVVEADAALILYGLIWIDGIVLLVGFIISDLLKFVYISVVIGIVLAILYFLERKKRRKKILDEMNREISQINIYVKKTQTELEINQRIVDSKNF